MASQWKKETETRSCVVIQSHDEEEMKYDPNMAIKTEDLPAIKIEPGTSARPFEDLSAAQEQVSLMKSLISKTVKLEAEVLEKDATLEQLRREMVEMRNTTEAEKQLLLSRLDQQKADNDAITQRLALEAQRLRKDNIELKLKAKLREKEKKSLQARCQQLESELAPVTHGAALDKQGLGDKSSLTQQKLELELKFEAEKKSLKKLSDRQHSEILKLQQKLRIEVELQKEETKSRRTRESEKAALSQRFAQWERNLREENLGLKQKLKFQAERTEAEKQSYTETAAMLREVQERRMNLEINSLVEERRRLEQKCQSVEQTLQSQLNRQRLDSAALKERCAQEERRLREENLELQKKFKQSTPHAVPESMTAVNHSSVFPSQSDGSQVLVPQSGFGQPQVIQTVQNPMHPTSHTVQHHQNHFPRHPPLTSNRWDLPPPQQHFGIPNAEPQNQGNHN